MGSFKDNASMIASDVQTSLQSGDLEGLRAALTSLRPPEAAEALSVLSKGDLVIETKRSRCSVTSGARSAG
jgi:hypothetical protein